MRTKTLKKNKINVVTLGCSKNVYDSEILMGQLKANGKDVAHEEKGNIVVINTCGFINNAKEESVNTILEYVKKKEEGEVDKVFVTGCLSERYKPDLIKEIPSVDEYFGTTELPGLLKALGADYKHELIGERLTTTPKNYAYLKIAEGCDRPCSFCAIPIMRGKHRSTPIEEIVIEAKKLADELKSKELEAKKLAKEKAMMIANEKRILAEKKKIEPSNFVILEGVYSNHIDLRSFVDQSILLKISEDERKRRLVKREGQISDWSKYWASAENWYFTNISLQESFDKVVENI